MTASIAAPTTTPITLIYKGGKKKPQHKHIDRDPTKKRRKTSNAREIERMRTLAVALRPKPGKWKRPCNHRRQEHHSESPPQCNALGGPTSHLQLQSFHYRPGLHNSSNSKSSSSRSGLADNKTLASMTGSGARKDADSYFTNTIRLYTKNSLSIHN
jgi:hypothetical protein